MRPLPTPTLTLAWVPHDWVRGLFYDDFDVRFGETFYDGTWFDGVDQADLLSRITCPTVYLKAQTSYGEDGTLLAAYSDGRRRARSSSSRVARRPSSSRATTFTTSTRTHSRWP